MYLVQGVYRRLILTALSTAIQLGKAYDNPTFGWDIDYGDRTVEVAPFLACQNGKIAQSLNLTPENMSLVQDVDRTINKQTNNKLTSTSKA
jgi:hypothetical protein